MNLALETGLRLEDQIINLLIKKIIVRLINYETGSLMERILTIVATNGNKNETNIKSFESDCCLFLTAPPNRLLRDRRAYQACFWTVALPRTLVAPLQLMCLQRVAHSHMHQCKCTVQALALDKLLLTRYFTITKDRLRSAILTA